MPGSLLTGAMLAPGASIDRYEVVSVLGRGGMAIVLEVRHRDLGTAHALKVLAIELPGLRERMLFEGRAQAGLHHPNVCRVSDVIRVQGAIGLVMDLVRGPSLEQLLEAVPPNLLQVDWLAAGILDGIAAAHAAGLVHRDLKTANVLVDLAGGRVTPKVADFGLARALDDDGGARETRSGMRMGTPGFMAPEQFRDSKTADQRADVFSTGCILYELVSGGVPAFLGEGAFQIYEATSTGRFRPVADVAPNVPLRMQRAIEGALAPDPERRVPSIAALRELWFEGAPAPSPSAFEPAHLAVLAARIRPAAAGTGTAPDGSPLGSELRPPTLVPSESAVGAVPASDGTRISASSPALVGAGALIGAALVLVALAAVGIGGLAAWWATRPPELPEVAAAPPPAPSALTASAPAPVPAAPAAAPPAPVKAAPAKAAPAAPRTLEPMPAPPVPTVVAAPPPAPPAAPEVATVEVTGVRSALLVGAGGERVPPGAVPPGTWKVLAFFEEGRGTPVLDVTVRAGERRAIACDASLRLCR